MTIEPCTAELALRERRRDINSAIERLESQKKDYSKKTSRRTAYDKRYLRKLDERIQVLWNQHTEQMMIASRAGIRL